MRNSLLGLFILLLYFNWIYGRILEAYVDDTSNVPMQTIEVFFSLINLIMLLIINKIMKFNFLIKYIYVFLVGFHAINLATSMIWLSGLRKDKLFDKVLEFIDIISTILSYSIVTFLCVFIYVVFVN